MTHVTNHQLKKLLSKKTASFCFEILKNFNIKKKND
jgi:hypothetical protein